MTDHPRAPAGSARVFRTQNWVASDEQRVNYVYAEPWEWDEVRRAVLPPYRYVVSLISAVFAWLTWLGEPIIAGVHDRWTSEGTAALLRPTLQAAILVALIGMVGLAVRVTSHLAGGRRAAMGSIIFG